MTKNIERCVVAFYNKRKDIYVLYVMSSNPSALFDPILEHKSELTILIALTLGGLIMELIRASESDNTEV